MHVALICQPVFSISLPISWAFRSFSSFSGLHALLAYLGIHFHIWASICHQIVTKNKLSTDIQQAEPLHLRTDSIIVQMIVNRISNSQILLPNQRLQNFKVTSFRSHFCYICMSADMRWYVANRHWIFFVILWKPCHHTTNCIVVQAHSFLRKEDKVPIPVHFIMLWNLNFTVYVPLPASLQTA